MRRQRRTEYVRSGNGELVREQVIASPNEPNRSGPHPETEVSSAKFRDYRGSQGNRKQNEQERHYAPGEEREITSDGAQYISSSDVEDSTVRRKNGSAQEKALGASSLDSKVSE